MIPFSVAGLSDSSKLDEIMEKLLQIEKKLEEIHKDAY